MYNLNSVDPKRLFAEGNTPTNLLSSIDNDLTPTSKNMGVKDLLRFQMIEKKLLEVQTKLHDQEIMSALQQKEKNEDDIDK